MGSLIAGAINEKRRIPLGTRLFNSLNVHSVE